MTGQKRVDPRACDLIRALSRRVRPAACTDTVAATRLKAMKIFKGMIRGCPRQALADMDLVRWIVRFVLLNGSFTEIGAATGKASSRKSGRPSPPLHRQTTSIAHCSRSEERRVGNEC